LITVQDSSVTTAQYVYNALNQRIKKILPGNDIRIFHYDLKGHLIAETTAAGQMIAEYIYLADELLAMIRKPGQTEYVYYFHNDHLPTPQILTDDSQNIVWEATYKPFGEAVLSIEAVENPFRYPGQYYDQETGLHYNWNRYYDPKTGRYFTPDPIGLEGGINLFPYVQNNPIRGKHLIGLGIAIPSTIIIGPIPFPIIIVPIVIWITYDIIKEPIKAIIEDIKEWDCERKKLHEHCVKLFKRCDEEQWRGDCGQCLLYCERQGEWDFLNCPANSHRW
jgi:RHS repeat-associated protein